MSLFKKKNKFNLINDNRITLDAFHNKKMKDLDKGINVKKGKLEKKKKDISKLLNKLLKIPNNKLTDEEPTIELYPMSSLERKAIHTLYKDHENIKTYSKKTKNRKGSKF